ARPRAARGLGERRGRADAAGELAHPDVGGRAPRDHRGRLRADRRTRRPARAPRPLSMAGRLLRAAVSVGLLAAVAWLLDWRTIAARLAGLRPAWALVALAISVPQVALS